VGFSVVSSVFVEGVELVVRVRSRVLATLRAIVESLPRRPDGL
jgi:hypothetical protein